MTSRPTLFPLVLTSCLLTTMDNSLGQTTPTEIRPVDRIVPNVVWLHGLEKTGSGTLLNCRPYLPDPQPQVKCHILTVAHVLDDTTQRFIVADLPSGERATIRLRDLVLTTAYATPKSLLHADEPSWTLAVGSESYSFRLDSEKATLQDLEDALNRLTSQSGITAGIAASGLASDRTFSLKLYPMNDRIVPTALYNGADSGNLLTDIPLWMGLRNLDLALLEAVLPASVKEGALQPDDFASEALLANLESGGELLCSGYAIPPDAAAIDPALQYKRYAGIKPARIYSYPFPPPRDIPGFEVDAALASGQSGAPCFATFAVDGAKRTIIVGTVVSQLLIRRGNAPEAVPNTILILKSSLVGEMIEAWEQNAAKAR